jgi:hypothetical protein
LAAISAFENSSRNVATGEGLKSSPKVLFSVAVVGTLVRVSELGIPYSGEIPSTVAGVKLPEVWLNVKVAAGEFRARFPEITLLAARLIVPVACTPKLVSVIVRIPVLETDPPVRRARVGVKAGLIAVEISMFPVFVPLSAPMRRVFADIWSSSASVSDSRPETLVPKSITLLFDCGANVTVPLGAAMFTEVLRVMLSACSRTFPLLEVIDPVFSNVPAR